MLAISILFLSLMSTAMIFKTTFSSWISFVTILTFSSGMMTLFMYTASMTSNEKSKTSKGNLWLAVLLLCVFATSQKEISNPKQTMKMFSNKKTIVIMAVILIITMVSIATHGHHPNQTISNSF